MEAIAGEYILFSMQRSGTTTLCQVLNKAGGYCAHELLNLGRRCNCTTPRGAGLRFLCERNLSIAQVRAAPRAFVEAFLAVQKRQQPNRSNYGYKIFPDHVRPALLSSLLGPTTTCLVHKRENATAQFRSLLVAHRFGCWKNLSCHTLPMTVPPRGLRAFERARREWFARVEHLCRYHRIVRTTMESLLQTLSHNR